MSWYIHWEESFDLAKGGIELSFRNHEDMSHLLVETASTRLVDNIVGRIEAPTVGPRYHVIGTRGFGKSTLLNYMAFSLFNNLSSKLVLPVYCSIFGTATSEDDFNLIFFRSLLDGLFDVPGSFENFGLQKKFDKPYQQLVLAKNEYKQELKKSHDISTNFIYTAFENQLDHLKNSFSRIVFLIDGLDKQDYNLVLKFFRNTQERLNNLITKYNLIFVDSADPSWRETLGTKEFSGVRGFQISLRGWTANEVESLIKNRLHIYGIFQMPFEDKAIEMLVQDFQGNPREILQYCTTLLHYAASANLQVIGHGIAREIVWNEGSKEKFCQFIIDDAKARVAYEKLKTVYSERQMFNILSAIYTQRNQRLSPDLDYEERSSVGVTVTDDEYRRYVEILITRGCILVKTSYVELSKDVIHLFKFISDLKESLVALPVVLSGLESKIDNKIELPKAQIAIKQEIEEVFQKHPKIWINYEKCNEMLLTDPRKRAEISEYFGENFLQKLSNTINLTLYELLTKGTLMVDESTHEYRWRPFSVDVELANLFKSKKVLDLIDRANEALSESKFDLLAEKCQEIIMCSFSALDDLLGGRIGTTDAQLVINYLQDLDIQVNKPIPLSLVFQFLKEPIKDRPEGLVCLQASLVYASRIFNKISYLQLFSAKNEEIISRLRKAKTGNSKTEERKNFIKFFSILLFEHYGILSSYMSRLKILNGISDNVPLELTSLVDNKHILLAQVFKCPICGDENATTASLNEVNYCIKDKVNRKFTKNAYILSAVAYQAWTVWLEEYTQMIMEHLPVRFAETGMMLTSLGLTSVSSPEEIDLIIVFNGKLLAIECKERIQINDEKNDVRDIIYKIQNLGAFDGVVLVYAGCENTHSFDAEIAKNRKFLFPAMVSNPKTFKETLFSALSFFGKKESKL